jgi:hypothetical protein
MEVLITTGNVRQARPFSWLVDVDIDGKLAIENVSVGFTRSGRYAVRLPNHVTLTEDLFAAVRRAAIEAVQS